MKWPKKSFLKSVVMDIQLESLPPPLQYTFQAMKEEETT